MLTFTSAQISAACQFIVSGAISDKLGSGSARPLVDHVCNKFEGWSVRQRKACEIVEASVTAAHNAIPEGLSDAGLKDLIEKEVVLPYVDFRIAVYNTLGNLGFVW